MKLSDVSQKQFAVLFEVKRPYNSSPRELDLSWISWGSDPLSLWFFLVHRLISQGSHSGHVDPKSHSQRLETPWSPVLVGRLVLLPPRVHVTRSTDRPSLCGTQKFSKKLGIRSDQPKARGDRFGISALRVFGESEPTGGLGPWP